ncbi:hypothetical protein Tco_0730522 [Tanacetum coccineum]|uniref:Uncharacterized protein n=1 Tax=Tanacetum coccineum TaxID=301880 RepID=A0ABQ4YUI2_9ASTR
MSTDKRIKCTRKRTIVLLCWLRVTTIPENTYHRIQIRGKPLGKLIWDSIQNGPSPHPMVTDAPSDGQTGVNMPRMKLDSEQEVRYVKTAEEGNAACCKAVQKNQSRAKEFSVLSKDKMLLMEAKEKGATLNAEAKAFLANVECTAPYAQPLAMTTTNIL